MDPRTAVRRPTAAVLSPKTCCYWGWFIHPVGSWFRIHDVISSWLSNLNLIGSWLSNLNLIGSYSDPVLIFNLLTNLNLIGIWLRLGVFIGSWSTNLNVIGSSVHWDSVIWLAAVWRTWIWPSAARDSVICLAFYWDSGIYLAVDSDLSDRQLTELSLAVKQTTDRLMAWPSWRCHGDTRVLERALPECIFFATVSENGSFDCSSRT